MRLPALVLMVASACPLAAADDPGTAPADMHTDVRRELLSEFKFVAHPGDIPSASPVLSDAGAAALTATPEPDNPYLYKMPAFTVRESVMTNRLRADLLQEKADARVSAMTARLGIGLHVAPVGKAYVYAATLFYIPFAVGFGFSW